MDDDPDAMACEELLSIASLALDLPPSWRRREIGIAEWLADGPYHDWKLQGH
jgi:hypothetical protein